MITCNSSNLRKLINEPLWFFLGFWLPLVVERTFHRECFLVVLQWWTALHHISHLCLAAVLSCAGSHLRSSYREQNKRSVSTGPNEYVVMSETFNYAREKIVHNLVIDTMLFPQKKSTQDWPFNQIK